MEKILFIAHTQPDGSLGKIAMEVLTGSFKLSKELGAQLIAGLIGEDVKMAADSIASCGAINILGVAGSDFKESRYASDTAALEALIKHSGAEMVLAPATSRFSRAVPGAAVRAGGSLDTHVCGIEVKDEAVFIKRWYYRQRMEASLTRTASPWILLVDGGLYQPYSGDKGSATLEMLEVLISDDEKKTKVLGIEAPSTNTQTIRPDAELLFVAGAGWTKKQSDGRIRLEDAEKSILTFLEKSQASLGSSKSLVDQSSESGAVLEFMSHLNQIGQTGATPRHPKGLATCCHGEEPHVVGWRFINERRAINMDANCGWAQGKADVLYVADCFEVMEKINALL